MGPEVTVNEIITIANEWDRAYILPMLPGPKWICLAMIF